jgi:hypothetical protein
VIDACVRDPNAVLLVNAKVKRRFERLTWLRTITLANDLAFTQIAFGEVDELPLLYP